MGSRFKYMVNVLLSVLNKKVGSAASICLLLAIGTLVLSCSKDETDWNERLRLPHEKGRRTVLVYMAAQNSLGAKSLHRSDSAEMMAGRKYIAPEDRLLVYFDDAEKPRIYQIFSDNDKPCLLKQWDVEENSSNPAHFSEVLRWMQQNVPAEEYGLVLWSHSDGWLPAFNEQYVRTPRQKSFGIDVGSNGSMIEDVNADGEIGAQMNITDMADAIQKTGVHFRYIFFDACIMQGLEVAYDLRKITDFVVASPIVIPGNGAYYVNMLKQGLFSEDVTEIAKTYYEDVVSRDLSYIYNGFGLVISVIRTDALEPLAETFREVLPRTHLKDNPLTEITEASDYTIYSWRFFYRPHLYDALQSMRELCGSEEDYRMVEQAINQAVVYRMGSDLYFVGPDAYAYNELKPYYCGVSMFIPQEAYDVNASVCKYGNLNQLFTRTAWYHAAGWSQVYTMMPEQE